MMVTFVSQCEHKALNRTRRVLDAFANRIGSRTWQTVITEEGLQAVKKLLRQTATKNTAVSCHWVRSRSRSELVWLVGNRDKFNTEGYVPVNWTRKNILNTQWENDWHYLPLIKSLTAIAALFHDWGKSSDFFQARLIGKEKLPKGDPLRHEWISVLFLNAFVNNETDEQWLERLINSKFDVDVLTENVAKNINNPKNKPIKKLPTAASIVAWLIISHHRLPLNDDKGGWIGDDSGSLQKSLQRITQKWGYENKFNEAEFNKHLKACFMYSAGLPSQSKQWLKETRKYAKKLKDALPLLLAAQDNHFLRAILSHARLSMMLADHYYSSLDCDDKNRLKNRELKLYANTYTDSISKKNKLKQTLDEHLVGVMKQSVHNVHCLPMFETNADELPRAFDIKKLKQASPDGFQWQDKSVRKIKKWREDQEKIEVNNFGFFAVNMASTGTGKTFANAKIMRALSPQMDSLRYVLALGLRTLTLQTGKEYRTRIGLEKNELAVLIGSRAVLNLYDKNQQETQQEVSLSGSESEEILLDNTLYFDTKIPEGSLKTVLKTEKDRKFLYAPVLSCTIDHLMGATETKRGGQYILPTLRLMSSDLVIDEIDDFDGTDLIAIGRLIHLAGMLGRKVMISSATIPPDLAQGYFNAYQSGWTIFAKMREKNPNVGCAWTDENDSTVISCCNAENYQQQHTQFIEKRLNALQKEQPKRKANIVPCQTDDFENSEAYFQSVILKAVIEKHTNHYIVDSNTDKKISFGVVRMANIKPCIHFTQYLLNVDLSKFSEDLEIRVMAYHSAQLLIMRNEQEKHLDNILQRSGGEQDIFNNVIIKAHLSKLTTKHVIFIVVATPVEEVGRDHDFDWAVVEPSSYRSFIQLAGRVLRHRNKEIKQANIALLQHNLRSIQNKEVAFCYPGYESANNKLTTHNLNELVDVDKLAERLDSQPRISRPRTLQAKTDLVDLEHSCIEKLLNTPTQVGPETMQGWLSDYWWLTALPQHYVRFRDSSPQDIRYLVPDRDFDGAWKFAEKDKQGKVIPNESGIKRYELSDQEQQRLWLLRDYEQLLLALEEGEDLQKLALMYGEISLPTYGKNKNDLEFSYSNQLGLSRK
ncbi:MAG: CRISPR-associated endonuclease/helicase Cas3 [Methyloprofundus sp.]|nr:MAG: CRISPR-associated endonuclease/helicase Cas3 [Methyloprofundus sp.]